MKVGSKELFEVMRQVVRDELKRALPGMIREHLTETYLRKMVNESPLKKRGVAELQQYETGEEIEEIPSPKDNDDLGIYNKGNPLLLRPKKDETVSKLISRNNKLLTENNPLNWVYEGIKPIDTEGSAPEVPLNAVAKATGMDFQVMNKMVEGMERNVRKEMSVDPQAKMKELEARRKALDVPASSIRRG